MSRYFYAVIVFFVGLVPAVSWAQSTISGYTKDDLGLAVEYSNVVLLHSPDSVETAMVISDSLGRFKFEHLKAGEYILVAMQLGYEKMISKPIILSDSSTVEYDFSLISEEKNHTEITVTGKRPVITQEADKMVVNVENMMASSGLTAIDVLKRSPGISVAMGSLR
jgi:iron complex outermembrane receptor protein